MYVKYRFFLPTDLAGWYGLICLAAMQYRTDFVTEMWKKTMIFYNMIIRCYRLNARSCFCFFLFFYFILFLFYFILFYLFLFIYLFIIYLFFFFFFLGGGGGFLYQRIRKQVLYMYYEYAYNLQQLWISIIALWVNMFTRLWISIYYVMAVHYGYPWYNYGYP